MFHGVEHNVPGHGTFRKVRSKCVNVGLRDIVAFNVLVKGAFYRTTQVG